MSALISVCITTYNRKNLLLDTVSSVLKQSYQNFEILIVDDHSKDGTEEHINTVILPLDKRIKYYKHTTNKGLSCGRNTAIQHAKGEYFTFVDDDDVWDTDFLQAFLQLSEGFDQRYVFCSSIISTHTQPRVKMISGSLRDFLYLGYTPPVASQFYPLSTLLNIGGYNEKIKSGVDHDLWLSLGANEYSIAWLNRDLVTINSDNSQSRMTYNYKKRLLGIKDSLIIWSNTLKDNYPNFFFQNLKKNYAYNTHKKFLKSSLKNKNVRFIFHLLMLPLDLLTRDLYRATTVRLAPPPLLKQPTFIHTLKHNKKKEIANRLRITYED